MSSATTQAEAFEACRAWAEAATGLLVDYKRQPVADAGRPVPPYLAAEWPTDVAVGATPYQYVGDEIDPDPGIYDHEQIQLQRRRGVFRVEAFGVGAMDVLIGLEAAQRDPQLKALLRDNGVALQVIGGPTDTTELRDTTWEESAIVDFECLYVRRWMGQTAIIQSTTIETEIAAYDGDPDPLEVDFTVSVGPAP
jgi:hypothetical protein